MATNKGAYYIPTENYEYYIRVPEYVGADYIYIYCYEREEC